MRMLAALALLAAFAMLFGCLERTIVQVSELDARKAITEDLQSKYPDADVREILVMNFSGESWNVKTRVTWGLKTPCPKRIHIYYDYPKRGFETSNPETITEGGTVEREKGKCALNCIPCPGGDRCVISFEEQAIIASHAMMELGEVKQFACDFKDALPEAKSYSEYKDAANNTYYGVWLVQWKSLESNVERNVLIYKSGIGVASTWNETTN